jgi:putative transposase
MRSVFARLLEPLDRRVIAGVVRAHGGDRGVGRGTKAWTCERHLKALLFAQVAGLDSLREIVVGLGAQAPSFYHLNLRAPARTTLSDANAARPAAVFRDIAMALVGVAAGALRHEGEALIRLIDATPVPLKDARFAWAEHSARTRGLKLHLVYDPRARRPVWFDLTSAKVDDTVAARAVPLEAGATYVFDKGYTDFRRWAEISAAAAFFLTRRKRNTHRRAVVEMPPVGEGILADRRLKIGHARAHAGAAKNPLWDTVLREVVVARPDKADPLVLLTNDLVRPAAEIAALYKERWDIELLFKWLKQNLNIRSFWGRSENAVRIQIYVALIAFVLLRLLHHGAARSFKAGTALLLVQLKIGLFAPLRLASLAKPPPQPPPRLPAPQTCFTFR